MLQVEVESEVGDITMTTDESLTLYAAVYDADNNYLQDVSVDWTNTGNLDAVSSSGSSFTFDPSTISTTGTISISSGSLVGDATGTITVNGGNQSYLKIRDASGGGGSEVGDITMTTDESLTLYAAVYDADNNYLQDVSVDWTNTGNLDAVSSSGSSFTFDPSTISTTGTISISSGSLVGDATGTITVNGGNQSYLKIRDASGGGGSEVGDITMTTDESLTLYAAVYDADNNYLEDMNVNWSTSGDLEDINLFGNSILFEPELAFSSGTIIISSSSLIGDATGTITVNVGVQSYLKIRDASGGGGSEVGDITMNTDESLTLYTAIYDSDGNYLSSGSVNWFSTGSLEQVTASPVGQITFSPSLAQSAGQIVISSGSLVGDSTGTITVNGGAQSYLKIRDASGGGGSEVGDITMTTDESLTLYAAVYDADNNYLQDISVDWSSSGNLEDISNNGTSYIYSPLNAGTIGTIIISSGSLIGDATGTITVNGGNQSYLKIRDASGGGGV